MRTIVVSRVITLWIIAVTMFLAFTLSNTKDSDMSMYRFGPHDDLFIIGICIDTYEKYFALVIYCSVNTCFRNMSHNIIGSWITLNVQDNTKEGRTAKMTLNRWNAYEITNIYTIYYWFDWFIYIHLLLAQIDIVIIEVLADLATNAAVTTWYLKQLPELEKDEIKKEINVSPFKELTIISGNIYREILED